MQGCLLLRRASESKPWPKIWFKLSMSLYLDAKAAIAIMSREGLSKVEHIETRYLWIQDAIKAKRFPLKKIKSIKKIKSMTVRSLYS